MCITQHLVLTQSPGKSLIKNIHMEIPFCPSILRCTSTHLLPAIRFGDFLSKVKLFLCLPPDGPIIHELGCSFLVHICIFSLHSMTAKSSECWAPSCFLPSLYSSITFPCLSQGSQPQMENQTSQLNHSLTVRELSKDISRHGLTFPREMEKTVFSDGCEEPKPPVFPLLEHVI